MIGHGQNAMLHLWNFNNFQIMDSLWYKNQVTRSELINADIKSNLKSKIQILPLQIKKKKNLESWKQIFVCLLLISILIIRSCLYLVSNFCSNYSVWLQHLLRCVTLVISKWKLNAIPFLMKSQQKKALNSNESDNICFCFYYIGFEQSTKTFIKMKIKKRAVDFSWQ